MSLLTPAHTQPLDLHGSAQTLSAPFDDRQIRPIDLPGEIRDFEMPLVFNAVAAISMQLEGETLRDVLASEAARRSLYRSALLAAVAGEQLSRLHPEASGRPPPAAALAIARDLSGAGSAIAGTVSNLTGTIAQSATAIGVLDMAVSMTDRFSNANDRAAFLAEAAADADRIAALTAFRDLLESQRRVDPAMVAGVEAAILDIERLSRSRLRRLASAGMAALEVPGSDLAALAAGLVISGGPAIVLREAMQTAGAVQDFTERGLIVAAQHNLAVNSQAALWMAAEAGDAGLPLAALATLHAELGAEALAGTYTALYTDRWDSPLSLAAVGRWLGMRGAEGDEGPAIQAALAAEIARRAEEIATRAALAPPGPQQTAGAANPQTLIAEDFSGSSGIAWSRQLARHGPAGSLSTDGLFHATRRGAGGSGQALSLSIDLDQPVTGPVTVAFDANPIMRTVRNGCGDRCLEFPVMVRLMVEDTSGQVHHVQYGVNYGAAVGEVQLRNRRGEMVHGISVSRPRGQLSPVSHILQDTVPEAGLIRTVWIMARGWDFEGQLDNLRITMAGAP